ncbi:MAG TPA: lysoplasmalogenase family protein, partial [Candidatus Dormibacteraeota bacterium]|nr:lysoplasmalogenase family protein [Candidatus Dormibacteraeota bacterium]
AARGLQSLEVPVVVYIAVVGAMAASAVASGSALAAAGGWLFLLSDATLAWDRFVRQMRWGPLVVAVTYHLAQGLLAVSLVR